MRRVRFPSQVILTVLAASAGSLAFSAPPPAALDAGDVLVAEAKSPFEHIQIVLHPRDDGTGVREWSVRMLFGEFIQSEVLVESGDPKNIRIKQPFASGAKYADMLYLPFVFTPDASSLLMIGGGGGVVPTLLRRDCPKMTMDVVEIDPVVVQLAERYFGYRPNEGGTRTHVMDGRAFVEKCERKYDIIVLDAFSGEGSPPQLQTREFFQLVRSRLTERGVMHANLVAALDGPEGQRYRSVLRTVLAVFGAGHVYVFPKWYDPRWGHSSEFSRRRQSINVQIIATHFDTRPGPLPRDEIVRRAERLVESGRFRIPSLPIHARNYLPEELSRDLSADPILADERPEPAGKGAK